MLRKIISKKKKHTLKEIIYFDEKNHNDTSSNLESQHNTLNFFNQFSNLYENAKSIVKYRQNIEETNLTIEKTNKNLNTFFDLNSLIKNKTILGFFALISATLSILIFFTSVTFSLFELEIDKQQGSYEAYNLKLLNEHLKYQLITQEPITYVQYLESQHYKSSKTLTSEEKNEIVIHNIIEAEKYKEIKKILLGFFFFTCFMFFYLTVHFAIFKRLLNKDEWETKLSSEKEKNTHNKNLLELEISKYQMVFSKLKPNKNKIYLQDEVINFYTEQYEKHSKLNNSQFYILQSFTLKRIPPFVFDYPASSFIFNDQSNIIEDYQKLNADLKAIEKTF